MPQHCDLPIAFRCEPVELDDFALAHERLMPVPGIVGATKRQQGSAEGRHLGHIIVEVGAGAKQPQAAAYEVQTSPDPITPTSWTHAITVSEPNVRVAGLTSGQKRWIRIRAINRLGPGSWSDPACRMIP